MRFPKALVLCLLTDSFNQQKLLFFSFCPLSRSPSHLSVCVATASPLKFREAIKAAGLQPIDIPRIQQLLSAPTHHVDMELSDNWEQMLRQKIEQMSQDFLARNKM